MTDDIQRRMQQKIDDAILSVIQGTSATNQQPEEREPLTLDKLQRMMLALPPKETWLSSRLFPNDCAWHVKGSGESFTCAGSGFWMRLEDHLRKEAEVRPPDPLRNPLWTMNARPDEIDLLPDDTAERIVWKRGVWRRLREAIAVAMVPLPDWLRGAPEFGEFG